MIKNIENDLAKMLLQDKTYDEMTQEELKIVVEYETEKYKKRVNELLFSYISNELELEKERIYSELTQAIQNGVIKLEYGSEKLFEIILRM